jgi:hypothetical protein
MNTIFPGVGSAQAAISIAPSKVMIACRLIFSFSAFQTVSMTIYNKISRDAIRKDTLDIAKVVEFEVAQGVIAIRDLDFQFLSGEIQVENGHGNSLRSFRMIMS